MESPKMIYLKSLDGDVFEVEEKVAIQSQTLNNMIQDNCAAGVIPISNVSSRILAKVIEYCKKHVNCNASDELELKLWEDMFVKVDQNTLFDIIMAANYLDIKNLLDLTCKVVADMIKGKTPEEVRNTFNIKNDFSPEEQEEIRKENQWAFE